MKYLEELKLSSSVVARMTPWLKREARGVKEWRALDATYSVGEFQLKLWGWGAVPPCGMAVREEMQASKHSLGRRLFEASGYTFRLLVSDLAAPRKRSGATTTSGPAWSNGLRS